MLYQLPNGNYLDPRNIVGVMMFPRMVNHMGVSPPNVVIRLATGGVEVVTFELEDDAEQFRDRVAALVNGGMVWAL